MLTVWGEPAHRARLAGLASGRRGHRAVTSGTAQRATAGDDAPTRTVDGANDRPDRGSKGSNDHVTLDKHDCNHRRIGRPCALHWRAGRQRCVSACNFDPLRRGIGVKIDPLNPTLMDCLFLFEAGGGGC